jgi:hypothetical protein
MTAHPAQPQPMRGFPQFIAIRWAARGPLPRVHSIATHNRLENIMFERIAAPALTFLVLIAGHVAIASALLGSPSDKTLQHAAELAKAKAPVVQLEAVVITGKRTAS